MLRNLKNLTYSLKQNTHEIKSFRNSVSKTTMLGLYKNLPFSVVDDLTRIPCEINRPMYDKNIIAAVLVGNNSSKLIILSSLALF